MATTGALNGTNVFLRIKTAAEWVSIGGQVSHTETLTNNLVDITNKIGSPDFRELLPDEGIQMVDYTTDVFFTSQTGYTFVRALAGTKAEATLQVMKDDADSGMVYIELPVMVASFADTSETGSALRGTINLVSSDLFTWAADYTYEHFLDSAAKNFITSDSNTFYARA